MTSQLSINVQNEEDESLVEGVGQRVIEAIKELQQPDGSCELTAGQLAQATGLSVDDANAELCGLLSAVGSESSSFKFTVKNSSEVPVMVFKFENQWETRCRAYQRRQTLSEISQVILWRLYRGIVSVTSFGLIVSLVVLLVAAVVTLFAAALAMRQNRHGSQHLHRALHVLRQVLFVHMIFGHAPHHRLRDTLMFSSLICGNPLSPWFWMRAHMLHRRNRGWRHINNPTQNPWSITPASLDPEFPGLLKLIMEFLFGPNDQFDSNWEQNNKLRAQVICHWLHERGFITLEQLLPYSDDPPKNIENVSSAILIVAHFSGAPYLLDGHNKNNQGVHQHAFFFPELVHSTENTKKSTYFDQPSPEIIWESIFYKSPSSAQTSKQTSSAQTSKLPSSLVEPYQVLTHLTRDQFLTCLGLGIVNLFGMHWLVQSEMLAGLVNYPIAHKLSTGLVSLLALYSKLYFVVFLFRLLVVVIYNRFWVYEKNKRRIRLANQVASCLQAPFTRAITNQAAETDNHPTSSNTLQLI